MSRLPIQFHVEITGSALQPRSMAAVNQAIETASLRGAQYVKGVWLSMAQRLDVRRTGEYIRGVQEAAIERRASATSGSHTAIELSITNRAPHASIVEDGHAGFHLPQRINWGKAGGKIKHGKQGPYLSIPLRHRGYQSPSARVASGMTTGATKQMMPVHIYREARALAPSFRPGGHSAANQYHWGGRLRRGGRRGIALGGPGQRGTGHIETRIHWQASKYEGLVRMEHGRGDSSYLTFRTITPRSRGWFIPALHGHGLARKAVYAVSQGNGARRMHEMISAAILDAFGEPAS